MSAAYPSLKGKTETRPAKVQNLKSVRTMSVPKVRVANPDKGKKTKGGKKEPDTIKIARKYVPKSLSAADKKKQVKSIKDKTERPKVDSFKSQRSSHVEAFEKKYGYKISNTARIAREIIARPGIDAILDKGRGAYYSGGSRPNQTAESWARARLASVIMGGKARQVDKDIWNKHKK